ncbi:MAG: AraC family transcriptional regulator [Pseudomonadota bacterium]|nr:AraC family transcriptional regulator [Pseudomonadota bacterium]
MPVSSGWPLTPGAIRFFVPHFANEQLARHPLTESLYVNGMGYYPEASGHNMTRSHHQDNLIMYCSAGSGRLLVGATQAQVTAGDLVVLSAGVSHRYQAAPKTPWTLRWVHFSGQRARDYIANLGLPEQQYCIQLGLHPKIITDFDALFSVQHTGYNLKALIHASQQLKQSLSYLALLTTRETQQARQPIDLDRIQSLMTAHLNGELELDKLAAAAHLSKYHFAKRYRALTGYSPIQHFIHLKMERACYLLDISQRSVAEVAAELGYGDPQYFSRLFKKVTGLSPSGYRRLQKG